MKLRPQLGSLAAVAFVVAVFGGCSSDSTDPQNFVEQNWTSADIVAGGKLYDKWWVVNNGTEPTSNFDPIWASQTTNTRTGGDTWRCKECHGWDYLGDQGRYSSGSHFTGFAGVWTARTQDRVLIFEAIKDMAGDHDLSGVLSDTDVLNLTKFIVDGLVDMRTYINYSTGDATGTATAGQTLFDANCTACHGSDGDAVDLDHGGTEPGIQGVGWISRDNPQETLHKIRWGHPGTAMPSMVDEGLTDAQSGDILAYAQTLPFGAQNYGQADIVRGGKLYDKWWTVNGATAPTTDFDPIWASQTTNT
ncbi:MAG TPA: cytochrome c, partial [Gemmatimonadota bacterium]|nr:cytochrome c [Gemmatimonadota bacterium]